MNFFATSIVLMVLGGALFFLSGGVLLTSNASAMLSIVSIMAAAILVRLNRGIPTVEWKSVDQGDLGRLLDSIEEIAKAYIVTFGIGMIAIISVIVNLAFNGSSLSYKAALVKYGAVLFGVIFGLLVSRMMYVVWLDLDIIKLQRAVIASAASHNEGEKQNLSAKKKIDDMNRTRITIL